MKSELFEKKLSKSAELQNYRVDVAYNLVFV